MTATKQETALHTSRKLMRDAAIFRRLVILACIGLVACSAFATLPGFSFSERAIDAAVAVTAYGILAECGTVTTNIAAGTFRQRVDAFLAERGFNARTTAPSCNGEVNDNER